MNELISNLQSLMASFAQQLTDDPLLWIPVLAVPVALMLVMMIWRKRPSEGDVPRARQFEDGSRGLFGPLTDALAAQLPESRKEGSEFYQLLRQAGLYSRSARASVYAARFVLLFIPLVIALIAAILSPREVAFRILIVGGIVAAGLSIIPRFYVLVRRNRRQLQIRHGLADMMDMLSMCLDSGMPLSPSLDHVAKNLSNYPALGEELQIVKRQAEVSSLRTALNDFSSRVDMPEVRQVAGLLARGEQHGHQLANSLHEQADHFRQTRRQLATMHANRTPVILTFPLMFCFAPSVLILLMSPALLQLSNFFNPSEGNSILDGNERLDTGGIVRTLDELDQNLPQ